MSLWTPIRGRHLSHNAPYLLISDFRKHKQLGLDCSCMMLLLDVVSHGPLARLHHRTTAFTLISAAHIPVVHLQVFRSKCY